MKFEGFAYSPTAKDDSVVPGILWMRWGFLYSVCNQSHHSIGVIVNLCMVNLSQIR